MPNECPEGVKKFFKALYDNWATRDYADIDGCDIQDWMEGFGLIESLPVDPDDNEWGSDHLYFLTPQVKAWMGDEDG